MRITLTALGIIAALTGTLGVRAAAAGERVVYYPTHAVHAPIYVVYDDENGNALRQYWARPWQGRHYYPFTGKKPKAGRLENLNAPRRVYKPTPTYYQEWSTNALYPPRAAMPPADAAFDAPYIPAK